MSKRMRAAELAAIQNNWVKEIGENARHAAQQAGASDADLLAMDDDEEALKYFVYFMLRQEYDEDGHAKPAPSIPQFMRQEGLDWPHFSAWLKVDQKRQIAFEQVKKERGYLDRENLREGWWRTATDKPEDAVTHGDVHKAREAIAKSIGMFTEKVELSGAVTVERIRRVVIDPKAS